MKNFMKNNYNIINGFLICVLVGSFVASCIYFTKLINCTDEQEVSESKQEIVLLSTLEKQVSELKQEVVFFRKSVVDLEKLFQRVESKIYVLAKKLRASRESDSKTQTGVEDAEK